MYGTCYQHSKFLSTCLGARNRIPAPSQAYRTLRAGSLPLCPSCTDLLLFWGVPGSLTPIWDPEHRLFPLSTPLPQTFPPLALAHHTVLALVPPRRGDLPTPISWRCHPLPLSITLHLISLLTTWDDGMFPYLLNVFCSNSSNTTDGSWHRVGIYKCLLNG